MSLKVLVRENCFNREFERRVGNGGNTRFWKDVCVGDSPVKVWFPHLYSLSIQRVILVRRGRGCFYLELEA